jgi:hypothetical protein
MAAIGAAGGAVQAGTGLLKLPFEIYEGFEGLELARRQAREDERTGRMQRLMSLLGQGGQVQQRLSGAGRLFNLRDPGSMGGGV